MAMVGWLPWLMRARYIPGVLKLHAMLAVRRDGDDAAVAVQRFELFLDDLVGCVLQLHALVLHQGADRSRATVRRMKYSPVPVPETAQEWFDA